MKFDEYSIAILPRDLPEYPCLQKPLGQRTQSPLMPRSTQPDLSLPPLLSPRHFTFTCLSPKLQVPFFCLCNSFPEPISSMAHFYLRDFLNKLSLIV